MLFYKHPRSLPGRFRLLLAACLQRPGLPFADFLPEEATQKAFDDEEVSCVAAVARVVVWLDQQTYHRMPAPIEVREIHVQVSRPGFRAESFVVVTTLTDAAECTQDDIAQLYHRRWLAELDIRAIKITLVMDILRCRAPQMVRKETWTGLMTCNLIRQTMLQSARGSGHSPRQLSFTAGMQAIAASWLVVALSNDSAAASLIEAALANLPDHLVGHRPGRLEPRAATRRPKPHDLLTKPRAQARAELLAEKREKPPQVPAKQAAVPLAPDTCFACFPPDTFSALFPPPRTTNYPRCPTRSLQTAELLPGPQLSPLSFLSPSTALATRSLTTPSSWNGMRFL